MTNPASKFGPVAEREFEGAADYEKPKLTEWLEKLPTLDDAEFFAEAQSAIYGSAQAASWRGNFEAEHCRATACYADAQRRHSEAGHAENCHGQTLYSKAHSKLMREHNYTPTADGECHCDLGGAS